MNIHFMIPLKDVLDVDTDSTMNFTFEQNRASSKVYSLPFQDSFPSKKEMRTNFSLTFHQTTGAYFRDDLQTAIKVHGSLFHLPKMDVVNEVLEEVEAYKTVAQATYIVPKFDTDDAKKLQGILWHYFESAIKRLNEFQQSYSVASKRAVRLTTSKEFHGVTYAVYSEDDKWVCSGVLYNSNLDAAILRMPDTSSGVMKSIESLRNVGVGTDIFKSFTDVKREAEIAVDSGNTMTASILLGAAAEMLFHDLLALLWWESADDLDAYSSLIKNKTKISTLVKTHFHDRLTGGSWTREKPIEDWETHIAHLRNRTIHMGARPTSDEMHLAHDSLNNLYGFIKEKLITNISKYPITAYLFMGIPVIHQKLSKRKKRGFDLIMDSLTEPPHKTFKRWKAEVERRAEGITEGKLDGDNTKTLFVLEQKTRFLPRWFVLDEEVGLATPVPPRFISRNHRNEAAKLASIFNAQNSKMAYQNHALQNIKKKIGSFDPKLHVGEIIHDAPLTQTFNALWVPSYIAIPTKPIYPLLHHRGQVKQFFTSFDTERSRIDRDEQARRIAAAQKASMQKACDHGCTLQCHSS